MAILFSPPQIPPESAGVDQNLSKSTGIDWNPSESAGIDWNPLESIGIHLQFTIKDLIQSIHTLYTYLYKSLASLQIFKVYILIYF